MNTVAGLNALPRPAAVDELLKVCHSPVWAGAVADARPFADLASVLQSAEGCWLALEPRDWRAALAGHPRIGEQGGRSPEFSRQEQAGLSDADTKIKAAIAEGNVEYEQRFGHVFLISAAGRTPAEILANLQSRLSNSADVELSVAAEEHRRITRLRLQQLLSG